MPVAVVGRECELEAAERFLGAVPAGPAAFVLEGAPGIGKTALWNETARRAEMHGYGLLATRPAEAEAKLAFAGLSDLLGGVGEDVLEDLPAPQRQALEVALLRAEGRSDRRAVFAGFVSVLSARAMRTPVVVAVDDVQWLDTPSATALEFALRRLSTERVGLLASVRISDEPRPEALERALAAIDAERLRVGPLSIAALYQLIKATLGRTFSRPTLVKVGQASGGNPLLALELARRLLEQGEPTPGETLPVPESIEEVVRVRVRRLPGPTRDSLLAAAILAQPTVQLVDRVSLLEAEEAGLVRVAGDGRISFTHPLYASAVYGAAAAERRRSMHRHLAALVPDPEERARHLALGSAGADERVAGALSEAASRANGRGAPDAASELEELALRLTPPDLVEARVWREIARADYLCAAGQTGVAQDVLATAPERAPTPELRAEALLGLADAWWGDSKLVAAGFAELALADAESPRCRGRLHVLLSQSYGDLSQAALHARAAAESFDAEEDPARRSEAVFTRVWYDILLGRGADDQAFAHALALGPPSQVAALCELAKDRFEDAHARWESWLTLERENGTEFTVEALYARAMLAEVDCCRGRWPLAAEEATGALEAAELVGSVSQVAHGLFVRAIVDIHAGRVERARDACRTVLDYADSSRDPWFQCAAAMALGSIDFCLGGYAEADRHFTRVAETADSMGMREPVRFRVQADHAEAVVALGELKRAEELLDRLDERARIFPRPWTLAVSARCRGLVLAAGGETDAAVEALEESLRHHERLEMPFELARTLLVKGEIHRRRREKRLARESSEQALQIFEDLAAPLWAEAARRELARVRVRRSPEELTETEERIAALAAAGRRNREIAAELFMSPKTVEKRLASVYRKLGIHSRAELGARMSERNATAKT